MIITDKDIILPETLKLFRELQEDELLKNFFLVGGTALALQLGHRLSIDLDLFCGEDFETEAIQNHLSKNYGFYADFITKNTLKGFIRDVKVDLITHAYPLIHPLLKHENLRLASLEDIAAMKLNAIAHSGNRQKDFYDIYFLLEHLTLKSMLDGYKKKYANSNPIIPLKGLTYFEDIDFAIEYPILKRKVSFDEVKKRLIDATTKPNLIFS